MQYATLKILTEYLTTCSWREYIAMFATAVLLTTPLAIKSYSDYTKDLLRYERGEISKPNIEDYDSLDYLEKLIINKKSQ